VPGPLTKAMPEIEAATSPVTIASVRDEGRQQRWRKFATDARGAVITGQVNEYTGNHTVACFATTIQVREDETYVLELGTNKEIEIQ
jgi:hypothetical protein